jgi:hypothetical protein
MNCLHFKNGTLSVLYRLFICLSFLFLTVAPCFAENAPAKESGGLDQQSLHSISGFFRFTYDNNIKMPKHIQNMGLLGLDYFADITPLFYGGFGAYGSVAGTQGGLFTVGVAGGLHHEFIPHWWGDIGLFVGGGGGKSSLTGGGLMLRPHAGISYAFPWARVGVNYSYIDFPSGEITSQQVAFNLDLPVDFAFLAPHDELVGKCLQSLSQILMPEGKFLGFQRNDFALLLQAYRQKPGTLNTEGHLQDGTMQLVGAELDHYFTDQLFWWLKTSGAYSGIPNGYMDVLGGLGYHIPIGTTALSIVPQMGAGAGGGGMVDTGGGFLVNPLLGVELAVLPQWSLRVSSGYLWSPKGQMNAIPITGEILYHLDVANENSHPVYLLPSKYQIEGWRLQLFNQTYFTPQRTFSSTTSAIQLIGIQIDQLFTPYFFMSYQAAGAYSGFHAGGYATGMIGPGLQTPAFFNQRVQLFAELLVGAGGGGSLALSGGSLIEPVVGLRFAFTPFIGLQTSVSQIKALRDNLNTTAFNIGLTVRFDTLNRLRLHRECVK